jgi:hypothetical protein
MKSELAFKLIGDLMKWTDAQFANEFSDLQLLVDHKYDAYQGFQPASRFHIALLNWLSQFDSLSDRQTAYRFLKEHLVFVSQREMHHLVSLFMPIVERNGRHRIAKELSIPLYKTWTESAADQRLQLLQRRTLYVGLSDGARIDVFRRYNEGAVSNEQVVPFSEINDDKWGDLIKELRAELDAKGFTSEPATFQRIYLVDDFSGSGSSVVRWDAKDNRWKGKVCRFHKANASRIGKQIANDCELHVHHYLGSSQAEIQIAADLKKAAAELPGFQYRSTFSYVLPPIVVISDSHGDKALVELLRRWYDGGIEDRHTGKDIWYGYKQCGLPLVLEHNAPNNSVALLWASSNPEKVTTPRMKPLFLRRKRHSSNG